MGKNPSIHVLVHSFNVYSRSFLKYLNFSICDHVSQKGLRWGKKSEFEFLAFLVLYYIKKVCVNILLQYLKYFSRNDHLYISLSTNLAFVFNWYFIIFLIFLTHSQIYNFLIVWLRPLIFGIYIHQLIWIHCSWLCSTGELDLWPQGQITDYNMKISCLAHNIFVIGFSL